jgi:hypothetical protein
MVLWLEFRRDTHETQDTVTHTWFGHEFEDFKLQSTSGSPSLVLHLWAGSSVTSRQSCSSKSTANVSNRQAQYVAGSALKAHSSRTSHSSESLSVLSSARLPSMHNIQSFKNACSRAQSQKARECRLRAHTRPWVNFVSPVKDPTPCKINACCHA